MKAKKGDIVLVDGGVLTASPLRGQGEAIACEVLFDSGDSQTYVAPLTMSSPLYVFNKDITSKKEVSDATSNSD